MYLVEILLPVKPQLQREMSALLASLTKAFGGVTVFARAPAKGAWEDGDHIEADDVAVVEVMIDVLDRAKWAALRHELEHRLDEREIVIRVSAMERL